MDSPELLFNYGQMLMNDMTNALEDTHDDIRRIAKSISKISTCSLRVRDVSSHSNTFHVVSRFMNPVSRTSFPYFSTTFEEKLGKTKYDVSLGFLVHNENFVSFQAEGCFNCADEEYCSKQQDEKTEEDFSFIDGDVMEAITHFAGLWAPILADFAHSFGSEYMYDSVGFILDQVFDSWSELPDELQSL